MAPAAAVTASAAGAYTSAGTLVFTSTPTVLVRAAGSGS
jgi:hypothetical protein